LQLFNKTTRNWLERFCSLSFLANTPLILGSSETETSRRKYIWTVDAFSLAMGQIHPISSSRQYPTSYQYVVGISGLEWGLRGDECLAGWWNPLNLYLEVVGHEIGRGIVTHSVGTGCHVVKEAMNAHIADAFPISFSNSSPNGRELRGIRTSPKSAKGLFDMANKPAHTKTRRIFSKKTKSMISASRPRG
jgi:hypothetical protein